MDKELFEKYLSSQCTDAEAKKVLVWLKTDEGQQFLETEIDRDIRVAKTFEDVLEYPEVPSNELYAHIKSDINHPSKYKKKSTGNVIHRWMGIAAAIILSLFVVLFFLEQEQQQINQKTTSKYPKTVVASSSSDTTVTLADGSSVRLNADSELIIEKGFEKEARSVSLEGKAYFEVKDNFARPFVVNTEYSFIRVLGTKFEVEAYPDQPEVIVEVDEGKVRFFSKDERLEPLDLAENESATLRFKAPEDSVREEDSLEKVNFDKPLLVRHSSVKKKDPKIKFVNNRLFVALRYLERNYDVDIELEEDSLRQYRFTLTADHSLLGALERIADSLDLSIEYIREDDKLYLHQNE
ncbi:FecR family protein [Fodinibius sp.]|uniref:FecR family protein n=1 Tax=Fodinibius sp. TaxID=1872440 RepID=UPI002ACD2784|nr:FecR family protein [Fodinibius sp.]MDZ7657776.1 FecR family protein [Fodinibius sp.]